MSSLNCRLAVIAAVIACFPLPADAYRTVRRRAASRPVSQDVPPSPAIELEVADAVAQVRRILENLSTGNVIASPHLVSAIYYHDGFLNNFSVDRANADPERRIIGQISNLLTAERKARYMQLLHDLWAQSNQAGQQAAAQRLAEPVAYSAVGGSRTHRYAVDLFAREGSPVRAVSRGIVVLADRDWDPSNLFSTTSRKGGNSVIVFDPDHDRFYRYCHMGAVDVPVGKIVAAGDAVGSVGHSGLNASQPGHGRHLHFEINQYADGKVRAIEYKQLRILLRQWRSASSPESGKDQRPVTAASKRRP